MNNHVCKQLLANCVVVACLVLAVHSANAQPNSGQPQWLSTGQLITPLASKEASDQASLVNHPKPLYDAAWWAENTKGFDFSVEDHLDSDKYNRILWASTMGNKSYPTVRSGVDLRTDRAQLPKNYEKQRATHSPSSQSQEKPSSPVAAAGPSM
jgi:hypothetical protein